MTPSGFLASRARSAASPALVILRVMPYPARLLTEGEEVLFESRPHWIALRDEIGYTLAWLALWVVWVPWLDVALDEWIAWILTLGWIALVGTGVARWYGTSLIVTSNRLIYRKGLIEKSSHDQELSRLLDIGYRQSFLQRLVGAGDLIVDSGGHDGKTLVADVSDPVELIDSLTEAQGGSRDRPPTRSESRLPGEPSPAGDPPPPPRNPPNRAQITPRWQTSRAEQLDILARLHTEGKLTDEEFLSEKRRVLESD